VLVLDTDAISLIQRGGGPGTRFHALTQLLEDADDDVFVTVVSLDEQVHGAFNEIASVDATVRVRGYRRLHDLVNDYCSRPMLDYDDKAESIFDRLKGMKGRPATKDLRIASIALSHDAALVTGNVADFKKIPLLKLQPIPQ
jgi:tRNA(fMet)-specific endonuclease VapC